jgi:xanthine dehydrogenase accessory factor
MLASVREVFEAILQAEASGEPAALVTIVSTEGSTPQRAGAKMVVFGDGRLVGTIGGGCVEAEMARCARRAIETRRPETASYDLTPEEAGEDGLICGGRMQVFIEPIEGAPTLCLFGAGHVAQPLAEIARRVGFRVEVADDRVKFANAERFPGARIVVADTFAEAAAQLTLGANTYAVVVTRGHKGDAEALQSVLGKGLRFVGMIGSKAKVVRILTALREKGARAEDLAAVHAPVGLAIGATSPEEIAVSILAEMIAIRRGADPQTARSMTMALPGYLRPGP